MRVMQLIDSLESGGAERVAVNFANALSKRIENSFLCTTRQEGNLKSQISNDVGYLFLGKKSALDIGAILRLKRYIKENNIQILHAHSSSFFLATIVKLLSKNLKIVWHDHYGKSEFLANRPKTILKFSSKFFSNIFCVNEDLKNWAETNLLCSKVDYIKNFPVLNTSSKKLTQLKGEDGKRILCLANLREQKHHQLLIESFLKIRDVEPDWTLHLVGKDFKDAYSEEIKTLIKENNAEESIFIYGSREDTVHIMEASTIGVLSSKSEGLPLSLLEYGLLGLPTIATDVGFCKEVIIDENHGLLIPPNDVNTLKNAILFYIGNPEIANKNGIALQTKVRNDFSEEAISKQIIELYSEL